MSAIIRKIVTVVEETHLEMGQAVAPPTRRAAAIAVIENSFAGRYVEDLSPLIAIGEELGELLSKQAVAALGIDGAKAQSTARPRPSAKTANGTCGSDLASEDGDTGAESASKGAALIPSSKKRSRPGTTLDIPLGHKDAEACAAISMAWRSRSMTRRAPTRSWWRSPSPTAAGRCRGSAD